MRIAVSILLILCFVRETFAQVLPHRRKSFRTVAATYLIEENFEAGSLPSGWTTITGTPDWNVTADPGQGSVSARFDGTSATVSADHTAFANRGEMWGYFRIKITALPGSSSREVIRFQVDGAQASASEIRVTSTGAILIANGTTTSTETVSTMSTATWYHVFWYFLKGTGADGVGWVGFTSDGTIPTGNNLSTRSNMNGTSDVDIARVTAQNSAAVGIDFTIDRFLIDDVAITANP